MPGLHSGGCTGLCQAGSVLVLAVAIASLHTSSQKQKKVRQWVTCRIMEDGARDKVIPITDRREKGAPGNYSTYQSVRGVKSGSCRAAQCSLEINWLGAGRDRGQWQSAQHFK